MIYYNNNKIIKAYQNGSLINKIDKVVSGGTPPLPYDAEIEYLESTGTQYINTNTYITNTSNFEVGYEVVGSLSERQWGWAHQMVANGAWVTVSETYAFFGRFNSNYWVNVTSLTSSTENTVIYKSNSGVTVNGTFNPKTLSLTTTDNITTVPLYIFANYDFNARNVDIGANTKFKSFYLKNNDELVLDMIPVRVGQVGYMYDKVSGQLFGNAGTGSFILGADKAAPITSKSKTIFQYVTYGTEPTPPTPPSPTWYTLQDLIDTHTVVNQGNNKYGLSPDVKGITYFRVHMDKVSNTSKYVDLYRDNLSSPPYFGIRDDYSIWLYSAVDGYSSLLQAANSSSCTWAYWVDENTIEINVQEAMNDTVGLGYYTGGYPTLLLSFAFNV